MIRRSTVVVFALGLSVGLFGHAWWTHRAPPTSTSTQEMQSLRDSIANLDGENRKLQQRLAERNGSPSAAPRPLNPDSALTIDPLRVLANLQQRKLITFTAPLLDRRGKVTDAFATLFGLSSAEKIRLQEQIDAARSNLATLASRHSEVKSLPDGKVMISVQPFPAEGGKVYDQMTSGFADILGQERNGFFTTLLGDQMERWFGYFGAGERSYTLGWDKSGDRPSQPYTLVDRVTQRSPKGGLDGYSNITAFESFDALADYVGPITSLLPPDFHHGEHTAP